MMKTKQWLSSVILLFVMLTLVVSSSAITGKENEAYAVTYTNWHPGHYLQTNDHPKKISSGYYDAILKNEASDGTPLFRGIEDFYYWNELEPTKDNYDFSQIKADLNHLHNLKDANGKLLHPKLIIVVQSKAFGQEATTTPSYITGSFYGGGVYQTSTTGAYDPIRWNDNVRARLKKLYTKLGNSFNGNVDLEAVILPESAQSGSPTFINNQNISPDFSYALYGDAIVDEMAALKAAFPNTVTIQYANFPKQSMQQIADASRANGVGFGGPDIKAYSAINSGLIGTNSLPGPYAYYKNAWSFSSVTGHTVSGFAHLGANVQYADYYKDDARSVPANISDLFNFAHDNLHLNYMIWLNKRDRIADVISFLKTKVSFTSKAGGLIAAQP